MAHSFRLDLNMFIVLKVGYFVLFLFYFVHFIQSGERICIGCRNQIGGDGIKKLADTSGAGALWNLSYANWLKMAIKTTKNYLMVWHVFRESESFYFLYQRSRLKQFSVCYFQFVISCLIREVCVCVCFTGHCGH